MRLPSRVEHGVVARPLGAKTEIVAHQHVARSQALHQHFVDERLGRLRSQPRAEGQHHHLLHAAALQLGQLVAQGANACGSQFGLARRASEIVARVGLEREDATLHPPVGGFVVQQRQHGLVPPVHAVEITDGQRAGAGDARVVESAKDLHRLVIFLIAACASGSSARRQFVMEKEYIVTDACPAGAIAWHPKVAGRLEAHQRSAFRRDIRVPNPCVA